MVKEVLIALLVGLVVILPILVIVFSAQEDTYKKFEKDYL